MNIAESRQIRSEKLLKNPRISGIVALALSFVVCTVVVLFSVFPFEGLIRQGNVAPQTIVAPLDIENDSATFLLREEAAGKVDQVYRTDYEVIINGQEGLSTYLSGLEQIRADAANFRETFDKTNRATAKTGDLTADEWREIIGDTDINAIRSTDAQGLTKDEIYGILSVPEKEFKTFRGEVTVCISALLRSGIRDENVGQMKSQAINKLTPYAPASILPLTTKIVDRYIIATSIYDAQATAAAKEKAAAEVPPVLIAKGDSIVNKGDILNPDSYAILQELGYVNSVAQIAAKYISMCITIFCCFLLFAIFTRLYLPQLMDSPTKSTLLAILLVMTVGIGVMTFKLNPYFNPVYLGAVLFALLISARAAIVFSLLVAALLGIIAGGMPELNFYFIAQTILASSIGSLTGIAFVRKTSHRFSIITAGFAAGVAMALVYATFGIWSGLSLSSILVNALWGIGSGLMFAVAGIGLLPLWERLFDIATPARLIELGNVNNQLLQRLMLEAPGTYHHSMMVASLAEAAANAVGANALLARVGAYYHDIGKLKRPYFFKENQRADDNPHDKMDADISAAVIIAHVKDGNTAAQKAKLPDAVRKLIAEHHGTTLVSYFYHKAIQATGDKQLPAITFRYAGPKPTTKESAIVMLADSVEAGVRSLDHISREKVEEMTIKIINGKIDDGQLSSAPLMFADIEIITRAMLKAFNGILHERIEYPDLNALKEDIDGRN